VDDHSRVRTIAVRLLVGRSDSGIQQASWDFVPLSRHGLYAVGRVSVVCQNST